MVKKELITMNIENIRPNENNPRNNDEAVESVIKSIAECSYLAPILVDENIYLKIHLK